MDALINDSIKELYDELFQKYPQAYSIVKSRAGAAGEDIYKWLLSIEEDEWQALLQEIRLMSRKSLIEIVESVVKENFRF